MSAPDHLFPFSPPALSVSVQATFTSHFSRPSKSASPSSPLLPRALHSTNSTFMGSWEKSKSLPFFPSWAGPPVAEPSRLVGAAERVTRRVLLQGEKGKGQEMSTRGISPAPRLWDVWDPALPATPRTQGPALPCEVQPGPLATVGRHKCRGSGEQEGTQGEVFKQAWFCNKGHQKSDGDDVLIPIYPQQTLE